MSQVIKMNHLAFDTLQYAKKLKAVGVSDEQAEVQAEAMNTQAQAVNAFIDSHLATKEDLERLKLELKSDMEKLKLELQSEIKSSTLKLGTMIGISVPIIIAGVGVLVSLLSKI